MDIELFLNNFNNVQISSNTSSNDFTKNLKSTPQKIKVKLVIESGGSNYEKSIEASNELLKPLIIKLNNKIKKYEESMNKKNFTTPNKGASSLNLLNKQSTVNLSSPSLINRTSPDVQQPIIPSNPIVFGVSLDSLIAKERSIDLKIPTFISNIINSLFLYSLGVEGLFRISGSQVEIQSRKVLVNSGDYQVSRDDNVHVLTVLLKQFLRDLPEPICTNALYDLFLAASDQINFDQSKENGFEVLKKLVNSQLPVNNRLLLQHIIHFLTFVAKNQTVNLMGSSNLSRVFGPNLFWKKETGPLDIQVLQSTSEKVNFITEQLIVHYDQIFDEPLHGMSPASPCQIVNINAIPTGTGGRKLAIHSKLLGHQKSIQWMSLCDNGQRVWSLDSHGNARIWDSQNQTFIREVPVVDSGSPGAVYQMISASNNTLWTATSQKLAIWDVDGGLIGEISGENYSLCESQNNEIWVGGSQVLNIYPLDGIPNRSGGSGGELVKPIGTNLFMKGIIILAMCKVGSNRIWGCSSEKTLYVWDSKTKETIFQTEIQEKRPKRMTCIEIDDVETIWIGGDEGTIQIFNAKTFKLEHKIQNQGWDKIFHITSINKEIWASFWDTNARVFDPKSKEILMDYKGYHSDVISSILEVPNLKGGDSHIWFGSYDKSITTTLIKIDEMLKWNFTNIQKKNLSRPIRQGFSSRG